MRCGDALPLRGARSALLGALCRGAQLPSAQGYSSTGRAVPRHRATLRGEDGALPAEVGSPLPRHLRHRDPQQLRQLPRILRRPDEGQPGTHPRADEDVLAACEELLRLAGGTADRLAGGFLPGPHPLRHDGHLQPALLHRVPARRLPQCGGRHVPDRGGDGTGTATAGCHLPLQHRGHGGGGGGRPRQANHRQRGQPLRGRHLPGQRRCGPLPGTGAATEEILRSEAPQDGVDHGLPHHLHRHRPQAARPGPAQLLPRHQLRGVRSQRAEEPRLAAETLLLRECGLETQSPVCTGGVREPLHRLSRAQPAVQARLERPRRDRLQHPERFLQTHRHRHHAPYRHPHHLHSTGVGEAVQPLHGERPGSVAPAEPDRWSPTEELRRRVW